MGTFVWNILLLSIGALFYAYALNAIVIPQHFATGGIMGFALILSNLFPGIPNGFLYFLLNIPLFAVGWMYVSRRFFFYSIAGMTIVSVSTLIPFSPLPMTDRLVAALAAGVISGIGGGITLRSLGSGGGLDILSVVLLRLYSIRIGTTILIANSVILITFLAFDSLETVVYTMLYMFVTAQLVNVVVTGMNQRKEIMLISRKSDEIAQFIMRDMNRGVTIVNGKGGWTGQDIAMLFTIITFQELSRFKEYLSKVDPEAFCVVSETLEVIGKGVGNQPHW
jgi:uncharacterized membrane-anchored protein YitT (DUF2179 family)